jgi:hypothetical protein
MTADLLLPMMSGLVALALMLLFFGLARPFTPNVILVMFLFHVLQHVIPSLVMLRDPQALASSVYVTATLVTALLIPVGGMLGNLAVPTTQTDVRRFLREPLDVRTSTRRQVGLFFAGWVILSAVLLLLYVKAVPSSPLIGLLSGSLDPETAQLARRSALAGGVGRIFGVGLRFVMPLTFILALIGVTYFKSAFTRLGCVVGLLIPLVYNAWSSQKDPVAMLFVLAAVIILLRREETVIRFRMARLVEKVRGRLRARRVRTVLALTIAVVPVIAYPLYVLQHTALSRYQDIGYMLEHVVVRRIFWLPASASYAAFEAFTFSWDYTKFMDIRGLALLTGGNYISLSSDIAVYVGFSSFVNFPPSAIGNLYAQGGWLVLIAGVVLGAALFKAIENIIVRHRTKSPPVLALYALLLYGAFRFSWTSLHTIWMTETIMPLFITLLGWTALRALWSSLDLNAGQSSFINGSRTSEVAR